MKSNRVLYHVIFMCILLTLVFNEGLEGTPRYKEEIVIYKSDGIELKGFVVYDENTKGKRPAVLIVPEWWGLNNYLGQEPGRWLHWVISPWPLTFSEMEKLLPIRKKLRP